MFKKEGLSHLDAGTTDFPGANGIRADLLKVVILGAGIQGSANAAMLSASKQASLIVVERNQPGAETSSGNHGRAHCGPWNYQHNTPEAIREARAGRDLLAMLPGIWECNPNGLYCAETAIGAASFKKYFSDLGMPPMLAAEVDCTSPWIGADRYTCYDTHETSFNPAAVAGGLIQGAEKTGRCKLIHKAAVALDAAGNKFDVTLSDGQKICGADVVLNALGGWHNTLQTKLPLWRPELTHSYWRLLAVHKDEVGLPRLDRVITIDRTCGAASAERGPLAAIPHGDFVIFGCDMVARMLSSQDEVRIDQEWRPANRNDPMDRLLLETHAEHFPVLKKLLDSHEETRVHSFAGVYPEVKKPEAASRDHAPAPYAKGGSWKHGGVPGYFPIFGGSATTSILNAREACAHVLEHAERDPGDKNTWIHEIANLFPRQLEGQMIWNRQWQREQSNTTTASRSDEVMA